MPYVDANGVHIHYEVAGGGQRSVLLVHGLTSNIQQNWVRPGVINALVRAGFRTVALDCRGHGKSDKPFERSAYAGTRMGDDVIALMDHLHLDVADLIGYSMGGAIAASLLARRAGRFRRVVIAGAGDSIFGEDAGIPRRVPRAGRQSGRDVAALAALRAAERTPIDVAALSGVTCSVLILNGSADRIAGPATRLQAAIPGALVKRVPGTHFSAVAHPAFHEAVVEFLSS
jgi:pimeloyl-ACP methyl ester carboxylesterase